MTRPATTGVAAPTTPTCSDLTDELRRARAGIRALGGTGARRDPLGHWRSALAILLILAAAALLLAGIRDFFTKR